MSFEKITNKYIVLLFVISYNILIIHQYLTTDFKAIITLSIILTYYFLGYFILEVKNGIYDRVSKIRNSSKRPKTRLVTMALFLVAIIIIFTIRPDAYNTIMFALLAESVLLEGLYFVLRYWQEI